MTGGVEVERPNPCGVHGVTHEALAEGGVLGLLLQEQELGHWGPHRRQTASGPAIKDLEKITNCNIKNITTQNTTSSIVMNGESILKLNFGNDKRHNRRLAQFPNIFQQEL